MKSRFALAVILVPTLMGCTEWAERVNPRVLERSEWMDSAAAELEEEGKFAIVDHTNFEWDQVVQITSYGFNDSFEEAAGYRWENFERVAGWYPDDSRFLYVFSLDGSLVAWTEVFQLHELLLDPGKGVVIATPDTAIVTNVESW